MTFLTLAHTLANGESFSASGPIADVLRLYAQWRKEHGLAELQASAE